MDYFIIILIMLLKDIDNTIPAKFLSHDFKIYYQFLYDA